MTIKVKEPKSSNKKGNYKTVKQHSLTINYRDLEEFKLIAKRYKSVKNYVFSRYSGVNSLLIIRDYKKQIRDVWVQTKFAKQWDLPARYWKLALDDAVSNIKSLWSNAKNAVKKALSKNKNITVDEKHFIHYILKADDLLFAVLIGKNYKRPGTLSKLLIREWYVHNLIRRYIRKYKGSTPYSHKESIFTIDAPMYIYTTENSHFFIEITSTKPRNRIRINLSDQNKYHGTIRIILKENKIELHHLVKTKQRIIWTEKNEIGIDKGYRTLIATSSGHLYGEDLNNLLNKETERLNYKNKLRNQCWAWAKKYEIEGNTKKAQNIWKNNFGKKKYKKQKERNDASVKSYINFSLNQFYVTEKPSMVISEDLSFVTWKDKLPKQLKRKLSSWIKGYVKERIKFKCKVWGVEYKVVNAAYTSQICHKCGKFGTRILDMFECSSCGKMHADINAGNNIKQRINDKEINLFTPYKEVRRILVKRLIQ